MSCVILRYDCKQLYLIFCKQGDGALNIVWRQQKWSDIKRHASAGKKSLVGDEFFFELAQPGEPWFILEGEDDQQALAKTFDCDHRKTIDFRDAIRRSK